MKTFSISFCIFITGIIIGYGWFYYHNQDCLNFKHTSEYEEKIKSYIPPNYTKTKQRNYLLKEKFKG